MRRPRQGVEVSAPELGIVEALRAILAEPYGCPMCDSGILRSTSKGHWPQCRYPKAVLALAQYDEAQALRAQPAPEPVLIQHAYVMCSNHGGFCGLCMHKVPGVDGYMVACAERESRHAPTQAPGAAPEKPSNGC
jgi:hypothetical protein